MKTLESLEFDNTFARLPEGFFRQVKPTPLPEPYLVSFNPLAAELIGLDPDEAARPEFVEYFTGNRLLPGSEPVSALYAGHQFGTWVPQLGDGRAILLGEAVDGNGRWDVQLKGAGLTPFSRMGDGRAVLRSTIREYLCSEAMHALGIPTTRALCITGSSYPVQRERVESAAVLTRLAPTHVRFGSFEVFSYRGQHDELRQLADYVIADQFPHLSGEEEKYREFLREVVLRTARLIAQWQAAGWAHGVMNTDNMSIIGWTIDYGPFGFLDEFDPSFICNHSDHGGRYSFHRQPSVALWNLSCLAQALLPLVERDHAVGALDEFEPEFIGEYYRLMRRKFGLAEAMDGDEEIISEILLLMMQSEVDYSRFFRRMVDFDPSASAENWDVKGMFYDPAKFDEWARRYKQRLAVEGSGDAERRERMRIANPKYILRNHLAQQVIERAENGDFSGVDEFLKILQNPFDEHPGLEHYADPPKKGAPKVVVSCSS